MYNFIDVNEVSEAVVLPSEALQINGEYIEDLIPGYRTLTVSGREALSPELSYFNTGVRDGSVIQNKRFPARIIKVAYQLIAESNEAFRDAYNKLASILNVDNAELIFNDEPDVFFTGTPSTIGEVEPGKNAVTGEFEIFCADPFKYSVNEYEAEANETDGSILINYNGTYKAYPTLEAEFYNEDESNAALTGNGDCGYVAFFNENEKIIQLGDPDEADTESYAKSQTLVTQKFQTETAWNAITERNWPSNVGKVSNVDIQQSGNVDIAVASWLTTAAPATSGTLISITSTAAKPNIKYTVTAKASGRKENEINVKVTISAYVNVATKTTTETTTTTTPVAGAKIALPSSGVLLYKTSEATQAVTRLSTGSYYLWDTSIKNGRIRVTNQKSYAGKSDKVTGWINVDDIDLPTTTTTKKTVTTIGLGKGYGLEASIQLGSGSWKSVILKNESTNWNGGATYTKTLDVTVKDLTADTTEIEDIKFKVERTDKKDGEAGKIKETDCADLKISTYTDPIADTYYLMPETYGSSSGLHGPSITRTIPDDAAGDVGAKNFTFSYKQKMAIGSSNSATQQLGCFQALLISGSGSSRKIVAGVNIFKNKDGKKANLRFYVNGKTVNTTEIDLSVNNKYFGNNSTSKGIKTVKTSTITKVGKQIQFNVGGIKKTFNDNGIKDVAVTQITFLMAQYGTKPVLSYNGLYWAKFVKNNCDTWEDIPNKFGSNDVVLADCKNGEIYLNDTPTPALGALGNDWEDFYLTPGLNQIGFSYSNWVKDEYAPKFRVRYREVFI